MTTYSSATLSTRNAVQQPVESDRIPAGLLRGYCRPAGGEQQHHVPLKRHGCFVQNPLAQRERFLRLVLLFDQGHSVYLAVTETAVVPALCRETVVYGPTLVGSQRRIARFEAFAEPGVLRPVRFLSRRVAAEAGRLGGERYGEPCEQANRADASYRYHGNRFRSVSRDFPSAPKRTIRRSGDMFSYPYPHRWVLRRTTAARSLLSRSFCPAAEPRRFCRTPAFAFTGRTRAPLPGAPYRPVRRHRRSVR